MRWTAFVTLAMVLILATTPGFTTYIDAEYDYIDAEYDYVIVGSGPGGGPLACRLAIAGHKVLLIDAGDDQRGNINYQVPAFAFAVTEDPRLTWSFYVRQYSNDSKAFQSNKAVWTTPDGSEYTGNQPPPGSTYKGILYPRAASLGGSFSHNALVALTPHNTDWRIIQDLTGDESWHPSNMRKYFVRLEDNQYLPPGTPGHGYSGWLADELAPIKLAFEDKKSYSWLYTAAASLRTKFPKDVSTRLSAMAQLNNFLTNDPNRDTPDRDGSPGMFRFPLFTNHQARNGPADFIAATIAQHHPLTFMSNTLVTKVVFDRSRSQPCAVGVEFLYGQSLYSADPRYDKSDQGIPGSVRATKEVIIAGGAFNTPQILKLSGIGPKKELEKFGIPVVVDLPGVGTNLQDRYEGAINFIHDADFINVKGCTFNTVQPDPCLEQWRTNKTDRGPYVTNGVPAFLFQKSSVVTQKTNFPNDNDLVLFGGAVNFYGYFPRYVEAAAVDLRHWSWLTLKAHTRNRAGTVELQSADPRDVPEINFHYFEEGSPGWELDKQALVEGLEKIRGYARNYPKFANSTFTEERPGLGTDLHKHAELNSWGHHACCSAPIGANDNPLAVLDGQFKVRGVKNLRVVDASAFPQIPGLFLASPVAILSEKAADVILYGKSIF